MQFIHDGIYYKVARITGPGHNLLGLRLADGDNVSAPVVECLKTAPSSPLDRHMVVNEALAGVEEANRQFGTSFRIAILQFSEDDTPPESVYRLLAFSLIERLAKSLPFVKGPAKPEL